MTHTPRLRVAWFSPLPPVRSGIAAYSAEILPALAADHAIEPFSESNAHDFVWQARRNPFDVIVYQLGNAPCHDYMWAYLARYPGLVMLHDARLHHARARLLLDQKRFQDYRREFHYDHPDAAPGLAEYAVEGMGGSISYFWSMLRVVMRTARAVAVHNPRVAGDLREQYPGVPIDTIRMGVPLAAHTSRAHRTRLRRDLALPDDAIVFAAFGKVTPEKRMGPILAALGALVEEGRNAYVLIVGDADGCATLHDEVARRRLGERVRVTGFVPDAHIGAHLDAADVALCLRWPTAGETSASWLRCLAAARPTVISDLAHLVDIPTIDPRDWRSSREPVAVAIDLMDEARSLLLAMRALADDPPLRERLARSGHEYWAAHHTLDAMAEDYRRVLPAAAARPAPCVADLPAHFSEDHSGLTRRITDQFGVDLRLKLPAGP
jgi:glycosyltransferase involved in cell wall biosynthesis